METAVLDLGKIVKSPLIFPQKWETVMGKVDVKVWSPIVISLVTLLYLLSQNIFGAGGYLNGQSKDVQAVQAQVAALQRQVDVLATQNTVMQTQMATLTPLPGLIARLSDRLDAAPRTDLLNSQLSEINNHLHNQDGRLDADEARQRDFENQVIRSETRIDAIESSSKATLGNHR